MSESGTASLTTLLEALRAAGESTRLRILALLAEGELTVSELTEILGQSQPRVSRHLKLLVESGLVERHPEGSWAFFSLATTEPAASMSQSIIGHVDAADPQRSADRDRFAAVRRSRSEAAAEYFRKHAGDWDALRVLHGAEMAVERAVCEAVGTSRVGTLLDLGTGTGRMLELLAPLADRAIGIDASREMLAVARNNLERAGIRHAQVRHGDIFALPLPAGIADLVIVHQVLHFLDDGGRAMREAARVLARGGRLLVVDLAPHEHEALRTLHAHRRLGLADETVRQWMSAAGLEFERHLGLPSERAGGLTVSLWLGRNPSETRSPANSKAA
jgi:demethylmenaquinone methyltransferase/2-methoxy-6-polyprenyl-1,4-benzoquinol methylase/ArsR family transcriptional regulator